MGKWTREDWENIGISVLGDRYRGMPSQAPYTESISRNYKIGSRLKGPDGLTWHYCRAGAIGVQGTDWDRGMCSVVDKELYSPGDPASLGNGLEVQAVVGSDRVTILDPNVLHVADWWANGRCELWGTWPQLQQHRRIKSSSPSDGTRVVLTLYYPLTATLAAATGLEIFRSPYAEVDDPGGVVAPNMKSIVCVPHMVVTPYYYFWGLTWGLCTVAVTGDLGLVGDQRQICWSSANGEITLYGDGLQPAGYLALDTAGGAETAIMLQLDP